MLPSDLMFTLGRLLHVHRRVSVVAKLRITELRSFLQPA